MRPTPEKTLGYASTIDRHEKSGGSSNLHFDESRLARPSSVMSVTYNFSWKALLCQLKLYNFS